MGSSDPEVLVEQVSDLTSAKETVLFFGLFVPPDWPFFWSENYGWFCSVLKQSSRRATQNSAFEVLLQNTKILDHPLNQPAPPSLIHSTASVRNCEQVHTSVLNLIFQQANVAGVGNLSKWRSEICSRCSSAPWFFEESPSLGMTEFLTDGPDWHLWSWSCVCLLFFSRRWWVNRFWYLWTPWIQFLRIRCCGGSAKTFPEKPCVSQMLDGPSLRLGIPIETLSIPPGTAWGGKDTRCLVTWECPLRTDSASWKALESFIQWISFFDSCILPVSSRIVSWSSTDLLLVIVSKVEPWNFFNSSISLRLLMSFTKIPVLLQ